jgi:hypothetical protein
VRWGRRRRLPLRGSRSPSTARMACRTRSSTYRSSVQDQPDRLGGEVADRDRRRRIQHAPPGVADADPAWNAGVWWFTPNHVVTLLRSRLSDAGAGAHHEVLPAARGGALDARAVLAPPDGRLWPGHSAGAGPSGFAVIVATSVLLVKTTSRLWPTRDGISRAAIEAAAAPTRSRRLARPRRS